MYEHNDAFLAWGNETLKSELYISEQSLEQLNSNFTVEFVASCDDSDEVAG